MISALFIAATALNPGNLAIVAMVVGFVLPHGIALINQEAWRSSTKAIVAFAVCMVAAVITAWTKGQLDLAHLAETAALIFTVARASYAGLWQPTGVAPAIESATSVGE